MKTYRVFANNGRSDVVGARDEDEAIYLYFWSRLYGGRAQEVAPAYVPPGREGSSHAGSWRR